MKNEKMNGCFRPVDGKKIVIQHKFVGHSPVAEKMAPLLIKQLQDMQQEAKSRLQQKNAVTDSVENTLDKE